MSYNPQSYLRGHLVVVIDCGDLDRSAQFWTSVLGYACDGPASGRYQGLVPADGQGVEILLQRVPEVKSGKNRLHLDLRTAELNAEVERVVALGALRLTSKPVTEGGCRLPLRTTMPPRQRTVCRFTRPLLVYSFERPCHC